MSITDSVSLANLTPSSLGNHADVDIVSITTSVYWGIVEAGIGVFVACLPTLQFMFRQNKWKAIIGIAVTTPPTSADPPPSRLFKMKLGSNPTIQVDRTVDVTYAKAGSNPMLTKP